MRRIATAIVGLTLAAAAAVVVAPQASAATGPLYTVTATNYEFHHAAEVVLTCGTDYLFGVGFSDTGAGLVKVDRVEPTSTSTVTVHASSKLPGPGETQATGWALTAYAVCGPQLRLSNLQIVSATSASGSSTASAAVSAACPSTSPTAVGLGWRINAPGTDQGGITVTDLTPWAIGASTGVTVAAKPQDAASGTVPSPWTVTAFAICAKATTSAAVRYVSSTANFDLARQARSVNCGSAESRTSEGFYISSSTGDNVVSTLQPNVSVLGYNQAFAVVDTVQDGSGYNSNWALKTTAICATL